MLLRILGFLVGMGAASVFVLVIAAAVIKAAYEGFKKIVGVK